MQIIFAEYEAKLSYRKPMPPLFSAECLSSKVINKKNDLAALLLLFPNYINLTTVRRSFKEEGPMALFDKVKDIAQAVLEDDSILTKFD